MYKTLFAYTFIMQLHLGLRGASNRGWTVIRYRFCVTSQCFEWRLQASMAHDHCCVNFCSNDKRNKSGENLSFFNFPSNARRYWARWRAGFRGKSRVVTDKLLEARVISDPLFLSIEDLASSFLWLLNRTELTKNWGRFSPICWSANFFYPCNFFVGTLCPPWSMQTALSSTCKPSHSFIHILWLEVSRAHQSRAFLYLANSF